MRGKREGGRKETRESKTEAEREVELEGEGEGPAKGRQRIVKEGKGRQGRG